MTVQILIGDALAELRKLPADSVDCCVTSPPYWGLRDYGVEGQLGLERTLGEHIANMVAVFDEVRRVLKPQGSLWLNYGDCYATTPNGRSAAATKAEGNDDRTFRDKPFSTVGPICDRDYRPRTTGGIHAERRDDSGARVVAGGTLKPKDLCMIPNRLAIALQDDGWWVRAENVWGKANPMPDSSGRYRPSTAHEKIFLLTKSAKAFYDAEAVKQPASENTNARVAKQKMPDGWDTGTGGHGSFHRQGREKGRTTDKQASIAESAASVGASSGRRMAGFNDRWNAKERAAGVGPKSASEDTNIRGKASFHASTTGAVDTRFLRNYEPAPITVWAINSQAFPDAHFATFPPSLVAPCILSTCPVGGTVLDPFGGAGTTGLVADRLQRNAILIELNPEYAAMARRRIDSDRGGLLDAMEAAA